MNMRLLKLIAFISFLFPFMSYSVVEGWQIVDLIVSAQNGNIERLQKRLAEGVDPNARIASYFDNSTALIRAAEHNKIEAVRTLLKAGANPTIANAKGKTALDIAKENGYTEIVKLLKHALATYKQKLI